MKCAKKVKLDEEKSTEKERNENRKKNLEMT